MQVHPNPVNSCKRQTVEKGGDMLAQSPAALAYSAGCTKRLSRRWPLSVRIG